MFGNMFKKIPAKYAFAGYSVRNGLSVMMSNVEGKIVYDIFSYVYVDNYLSFYILMEDGNYKNVEFDVTVPEAKAEDLMSKHLYRGPSKDTSAYEIPNKDTIVGVFGIRDIDTLMKQADDIGKYDDSNDVKLQAILDIKTQYMGMEITGVINRFNKYLKYEKDILTVPPIVVNPGDDYKSLIGDEMDFFDFMSNKSSDQIIHDIKMLADSTDGIGNVKKGVTIKIDKGEEGEASKVVVTGNNGQ